MTLSARPPVILWFRRDLRLADHPALAEALTFQAPLIPLYILEDADPAFPLVRPPGGAARWWLHGSLTALARAIEDRGSRLILRRGPAAEVLTGLMQATGARTILASRRLGAEDAADAALAARLAACGGRLLCRPGAYLHDPESLRTGSGQPFRVFTPFWNRLTATLDPGPPLPAPTRLPPLPDAVATAALTATESADSAAGPRAAPGPVPHSWGLLPRAPDWAGGLRATWTPGEAAAADRMTAFLDEALAAYHIRRDQPGVPGTARLSPHLAFGELSPRQIWVAAQTRPPSAGQQAFVRELGWREFCAHLLAQTPTLADQPLKPAFAAFPWVTGAEAEAAATAWRTARTGYPIVDAGLRELWQTGWMHNRVRMIAASVLIKHLLVDWRVGERWFWDTLVDADPASNPASWQWVAGCGADAAPFFRIFNPVLQGERFDPGGAYVRRWLPELAALPDSLIHQPWRASPLERAATGLPAGAPWFAPIVDHATGRARALAALETLKGQDRS